LKEEKRKKDKEKKVAENKRKIKEKTALSNLKRIEELKKAKEKHDAKEHKRSLRLEQKRLAKLNKSTIEQPVVSNTIIESPQSVQKIINNILKEVEEKK